MNDGTYKLDELAHAAGTSARTVRYYVQRGLLPAPTFRGKDSAYGHEHLVRLRAIRRLQNEAFLPLDAIAVELERRSLDELERLAADAPLPRPTEVVVPERQTRAPVSSTTRAFRRFEIAPGLELNVADDAPLESRKLAEKILEELMTTLRETGDAPRRER